MRFIIHPHLGDFTSHSYLPIPPGIRWGVNDHVEFTATVEGCVEHGLKSGSPGDGLGDPQFRGKYEFRQWLKPDCDASGGKIRGEFNISRWFRGGRKRKPRSA